MDLLAEPRRPSMHPAGMFAPYLERYREWSPFVTPWTRQGAVTSAVASGSADLGVAAS